MQLLGTTQMVGEAGGMGQRMVIGEENAGAGDNIHVGNKTKVMHHQRIVEMNVIRGMITVTALELMLNNVTRTSLTN